MTEHRARVDELLAEYRRSREHLATVHKQLGAITKSASSADGSVTATVGSAGTLTGLRITDDAYGRFRPSELAAEIVRLTTAATAQALADAGEVLAPALPTGTDPDALLFGTADLDPDEIRPEPAEQEASATSADVSTVRPESAQRRVTPADVDADDDFESTNWVAEGWRNLR